MNLKDQLFNETTIKTLAEQISTVYATFDTINFIQESTSAFPRKELKERMSHVTKMLEKYLTDDYITNIEILTKTIKRTTKPMFIYGSVLEYIEKHGCVDEYVDISLEKLGEFTFSLSSEFAIRPFLNRYPKKTMEKVLEWAKSEDVHKRRLASEGTRPFLPWAQHIELSYIDASKALDLLYFDEDRYVTRSVANHLNDISKVSPEFVLQKLEKWKTEGKQNEKEMKYIIHHSLRTLIKKGHPSTMTFLGYNLKPNVSIEDFAVKPKHLTVGDTLYFSFVVAFQGKDKVLIDYTIIYPTKRGTTTSKTYKLKTLSGSKGDKILVHGKRAFKNLSTRQMRIGDHQIQIQVNGNVVLTHDFSLNS